MPQWELPETLEEDTGMAVDYQNNRRPSPTKSPPAKKGRFASPNTKVEFDESDDDDANMGGAMMKQVAYNSTAIREMLAMMLYVTLFPAVTVLCKCLSGVGTSYARAVKGKKGAHNFGPPHLQKGLCLIKHLVTLTSTPETAAALVTVKGLLEVVEPLPTEEACEYIRYCRHSLCYLEEGGNEEARKCKLMYRFEYFHPLPDGRPPMNVNQAILTLVKSMTTTEVKWSPAPPGKNERRIRYGLSKTFPS
jgi:hypothetical protein